MRVVGIDPGNTGAIALIEDGKLLWVHDMPTMAVLSGRTKKNRIAPATVAYLLSNATDVDKAYVEEVHAMPKQGVSSSFAFGQGYGIVLGVLAALKFPTEKIRPPVWRKISGVRGDKSAARHRASELFPEAASQFARAKDDGRAEAALIAYAGYKSEINRM